MSSSNNVIIVDYDYYDDSHIAFRISKKEKIYDVEKHRWSASRNRHTFSCDFA